MDSNALLYRPIKQLSSQEEQGFDYTIFNHETQIFVQQQTKEIKSLLKRTAEDVIKIGQKLLEVKEQLGHGHFEAWLRSEFNWGQWTARKFMQVTRQFKSVNFTDLSVDVSALYFLAAPSTPTVVRQEALELAAKGEVITYAKVKAIASQYKESAKFKVSKGSTIDMDAGTVECEASTLTEPQPKARIVNAESASVVKQSEHKLAEKKIVDSINFQANNHFHEMTLAADSSDYLFKDQATQIEMRSQFEVGNSVCITDLKQQDHKWIGEVTEVREANATKIEVVIKIYLQPVVDKE